MSNAAGSETRSWSFGVADASGNIVSTRETLLGCYRVIARAMDEDITPGALRTRQEAIRHPRKVYCHVGGQPEIYTILDRSEIEVSA